MNVFFCGGYKLFVEFAPSGKLTFHFNSLFSVVKQKHASEMTVAIFMLRKLKSTYLKHTSSLHKGKSLSHSKTLVFDHSKTSVRQLYRLNNLSCNFEASVGD